MSPSRSPRAVCGSTLADRITGPTRRCSCSSAPCVQWTERAQALGAPMRLTVYPEAHHGFDAPDNPVHYRPEVRNRNKPGGCCGATVSTEPVARADAIREVTQFFAIELGGRGLSP